MIWEFHCQGGNASNPPNKIPVCIFHFNLRVCGWTIIWRCFELPCKQHSPIKDILMKAAPRNDHDIPEARCAEIFNFHLSEVWKERIPPNFPSISDRRRLLNKQTTKHLLQRQLDANFKLQREKQCKGFILLGILKKWFKDMSLTSNVNCDTIKGER